jgi:hypothetical protein
MAPSRDEAAKADLDIHWSRSTVERFKPAGESLRGAEVSAGNDDEQVARIERQRNPGLTFPLAEACVILARISGPISRQDSTSHEAMKRRVRPIPHSGHKAVFYGIEMNVIDMAFEVGFVANSALPEPTLPKR